jgi:RHS repeat-associated protein
MLDNLNLTHMNGRVYDQIVGRFISADPFIPEPGLTQSFNRYSYVLNSPLTFTDPSGFCLDYAACHWMDGSLTVGGRGAEPRPSPNWYYQLNYRNVDVLPANTRPFPEDSDDQQPPPPKEYEQRVVVTITSCESDFLKCQTSPVTTAAISAPHPYLLATGALALTAAVGTAITGIRPPWSFFERPYAMNGDKPELVPRVEGSSESSPADPNQHDPKKGRKGEATIQFGAVDNQISHTFRHIDDLGLQRSAVQDAIRRDMAGRSLRVGETYSGSVEVGGIRLQYNAHQLTEEIINVGRITPP